MIAVRRRKIATGKLTAVDSAIDTTTGTVKLRAMFDNSDNALFPNQFVNVRLLVDTLHDQTLVPVAAIQRGAEGTYRLCRQPRQDREHARGDAWAERSGTCDHERLRPGDTVVVDGADRLKDGAEVTIPKPVGAIPRPVLEREWRQAAAIGRASRALRGGHETVLRGRHEEVLSQGGDGHAERRQCFRENMSSFSDDCRNALAKLRRGKSGGGFGFGGGGG